MLKTIFSQSRSMAGIYWNGLVVHGIAAALWMPACLGASFTGYNNAPNESVTLNGFGAIVFMGATWPFSYLGVGLGYLGGLVFGSNAKPRPCQHTWYDGNEYCAQCDGDFPEKAEH